MRSKVRFIFFVFFFGIISVNSQILKHKDVPFVKADNTPLKYPLMGGMNCIQIGEMDLNLDGIMDLVLFDKDGDVLMPLIYHKETREYTYEPEYKHIFPVIKDWVVFKDYNKDGLTDIFSCSENTEGILGIELYTAFLNSGNIKFKKFSPDTFYKYKILPFVKGGKFINFPAEYTDLLTIDDVDGDGDLDIILFESQANRTTLYQNVSLERGYGLDTLIYVRAKSCYGGFVEDNLNSQIHLSNNSDSCFNLWNPVLTSRHAGSTVLSVDLNGDGLEDLLIGDLFNSGITAVYNGGTIKQAFMTSQKQDWPSPNDSVNLQEFLGAFSVDIDHDDLSDIIISPNAPGNSENTHNVWYYRNTGTKQNPKFELQTKDLFTSETIDLGAGSDPCFVDYNQDGLMDILVGTEGFVDTAYYQRDARLVLFENIGTKKFPKYKLVDSNYLNFREFALAPDFHNSFSPCFGDLDNDGDLDLLVGEYGGQFYYCENIAGKGMPFKFKKPVFPYKNLSVNAYSTPFIVDLNRDGLPDIVSGSWLNSNDSSGKSCGSFYYFQNLGTVGNPEFNADFLKVPNSNCLGKIIVKGNYSQSYTSPEIMDFNGTYKLFCGNYFGEIKIISNIENNVQGQFVLENENYGQLLEGQRTRISLADIDDDGILEMVVGNYRGGLAIFETNIKVDGTTKTDEPQQENFNFFPNPSRGILTIVNHEIHQGLASIYSIEGKMINSYFIDSNSFIDKDLSYLKNGIYIITIQSGSKRDVVKWIKI